MNWDYIEAIVLSNNRRSINEFLDNPVLLELNEQILLRAASLLRDKHYYPECLKVIEVLEGQVRGDALFKALYLKADVYLDNEKYQDAIVCYNAILSNQETDIAYNNRGLAYWSIKQYEKALSDYKRAVELNFYNAVSYRGAGEMCLKLDLAHEAVSYFEKAIKIKPDYVDALVGLGVAFYQDEQWEKSYEILLNVIKLDPKNDLANRGVLAIEQNFDLDK